MELLTAFSLSDNSPTLYAVPSQQLLPKASLAWLYQSIQSSKSPENFGISLISNSFIASTVTGALLKGPVVLVATLKFVLELALLLSPLGDFIFLTMWSSSL